MRGRSRRFHVSFFPLKDSQFVKNILSNCGVELLRACFQQAYIVDEIFGT